MKEILPIQLVCELARSIPCAPWLLPKLMKLLANPEQTGATDIQALITKDPGLTTAVLRTANSAYFSQSIRCETVADAVLRIGFRPIYRIAASSIASRWLVNQPDAYGWEPQDLYKHSLCVAVATEAIAKATGKVPVDLAYTAGLLHDVGKLALAHACAEHFEQVRQYQMQHLTSWRQAEHEILGYDHTDVGGVLMEQWGYPTNLIQVSCFYPRPGLSGTEHRELVVHAHAGKHLATSLGYGVGEDGFQTELDETLLMEHGITEEMLEKLLPSVVEGTEKLIGVAAPQREG